MTETYLFAGGRTTILVAGAATGGRFAVLRDVQPPGNSTPPHFHDVDWETVCVVRGTMQVETRGAIKDLPAGSVTTLPPGEVHRLANGSGSETESVILCVPAGFEDFVRAVGLRTDDLNAQPRSPTDDETGRLIELAGRFGVRIAI